jgi:hypothetical protein
MVTTDSVEGIIQSMASSLSWTGEIPTFSHQLAQTIIATVYNMQDNGTTKNVF